MAGDLEGFSFEQRHGKDRVRVARVWRTGDGRHFMVEWDVSIRLFSDIVGAYTRNDNSGIVATDTMKNTVYVKAKECSEQPSVEHFAILLAKHFTSFYKEVTAAVVKIVEKPWERVCVDGQPHEHGFKLGSEKHTTEVTVKKSGALELTSGIAGLSVLKTAMEPMSTGLYPSDPFILWVPKINDCDELSLVDSGPRKNFPFGWHQQSADASLIGQVFKCRAWSAPNASSVLGFDGPMRELHYLRAGAAKGALDPSGFEGFIRDKYTSLPETCERVLATEVTASWRYSYDTLSSIPRDLLYFQERYKDAKKVLLYTFFGPPKEGVYSASLESTLYQMARAVLSGFPDISAVQLKMPNLHFSPVNISTKDNPSMVKFNNDVYLPTDEPHGSIQASLSRFCSRM